jgi:sarcosine oxidase
MPYHTIIVGLGAMGSAAAWQIARRGGRVLAFDRYDPPHPLGSTHGRTRITREAYFEHPAYVPFIRRSFELWTQTEDKAGERLFLPTGGLMIGRPDGEIVSGALTSARTHGVAHEVLTPTEVRRRFPVFEPQDDMVGVLEHRAGILFAERIVAAHLRLAAAAGADIRTNTRVARWSASHDSAEVTTADGQTYRADRLVLAAGPWMSELLEGSSMPLQGERQLMYWFTPQTPNLFDPAQCPIALWDDPGLPAFATFPDMGDGVKIAIHHGGKPADPETLDRTPRPADEQAVRDRLARYVPSANGTLADALVCIYTNTPDAHFIIDYLDDARRVVIASPCSGHGFKFASAVGEAVASLVMDERPLVDLSLFSLRRFDPRSVLEG